METTSAQPILALKLTEGEHRWFEAWRRHYLGHPYEIEKGGWMGEWKNQMPEKKKEVYVVRRRISCEAVNAEKKNQ